jgi:putative transcriptional regulator
MKNRVRELREARGWTQVDFGNRLNVSRQTVYAIESGLYDPSLPLALAIGKLFGSAVEEIFDDDSGGAGGSGPAKNQSSAGRGRTR